MPARQQKDARERRKPEHDFERAPARARAAPRRRGHVARGGDGVFFGGGRGPPPREGGGPPGRGGGGGRDPRPIPPFFKGREEIAARAEPTVLPPTRGG